MTPGQDFIKDVNKINIALTLPLQQRVMAVRQSQFLSSKYETEFVLGLEYNYPHLTLCSIAFPLGNMSQVYETVSSLAAGREDIICTPSAVETHQGYIGVRINPTDGICALHAALLDTLAPLRAVEEGSGDHFKMSLTARQQECIQLYGYPDALELYNPHFTLGRLKREADAQKAVSEINWSMHEFVSRSVGIYFSGDHGTCPMGIMECPFWN